MNLADFKDMVEKVVESIETQGNIKMAGTENGAGDIPVVIRLSEPGIGASPVSNVAGAMLGFDWDTGKFIIQAEDELVRKSFERKKALK